MKAPKRSTNPLRTYLRLRLRKVHKDASDVSDEFLIALYHVQSGRCAITKRPMTLGSDPQTNLSIDRIDNSQPYTRDNVQLVCAAVNFMKHTLDEEDFLEWCRAVSAAYAPTRPRGGGSGE